MESVVYNYFTFWLQTPVFLELSSEIRITFLQLVYLVLELPESIGYFKQSEVLLSFIEDALLTMEGTEGVLLLLICQRLLKRDSEYACSSLATHSSLQNLTKHLGGPLKKHAEYCLFLI